MEAVEKRVYSATGQDGITEHILDKIGFTNKLCVEFGAESGIQCNTRYIIEKYNMTNIWMDCHYELPDKNLYREFVTQENIVSLFQKYKIPSSFDVLAVDIDGNDWYVLHQILMASYKPRVIICEYNGIHGPTEDKIVVYDPNFRHDGSDYFGTSLLSLQKLMNHFGYALIATDSHGVDSFFVLNEYANLFENANNTAALYHLPKYKYGYHPRPYGHTPDPLRRPYVSSDEFLGLKN